MKKKILMALALAPIDVAVHASDSGELGDQQQLEAEVVRVTGSLNRYGATKSDIPILETARSVSVIQEEFIRDIGALTVDDAVVYTSGVLGDSFGFSTRGDFIKVRGFDAAEYRDGQQVLFGFYNNTRSDVYFLEQIEVLKGPASVLYGKGTPGGIVNSISKVAGEGNGNRNGSEVMLDLGTYNRVQLGADVNAQLGDTLFSRVVGLYRDSDTQVDNVNDDAVGIMPSLTWQSGGTSITGLVEYMDRKSDTSHQFLPINATGCLNDSVSISPDTVCANVTSEELDASDYHGHPGFNRYDTTSTLVSVLGSHAFNDSFEIEGVVRHKSAEADYRQAWVSFWGAGNPRVQANGDAVRSYYLSDASTEQLAVDLRTRLDVNTGLFEHELVFGLAYQDVETDNNTVFEWGAGAFNVNNIQSGDLPDTFLPGAPVADSPTSLVEDQGIYANDQISMGDWKFNVGLRYDDIETGTEGSNSKQNDSELSTSFGILYAFNTGWSPYVSYAESFEPVIGVDTVTEDQLKPRRGKLTEAGVKYQAADGGKYLTFALFDIEESNLPNPAALQGQISSQQEGIGSSTGVELEGFIKLGDFDVKSSLTMMDTETANDTPFDSIPEQQFSTWLNYAPSFKEGVKVGFGLRYLGENQSSDIASGVNIKTDGYTVADALISYAFTHADLYLNIRNLTDETYYSTCLARGDCFPGEERTVALRGVYRF